MLSCLYIPWQVGVEVNQLIENITSQFSCSYHSRYISLSCLLIYIERYFIIKKNWAIIRWSIFACVSRSSAVNRLNRTILSTIVMGLHQSIFAEVQCLKFRNWFLCLEFIFCVFHAYFMVFEAEARGSILFFEFLLSYSISRMSVGLSVYWHQSTNRQVA